MDGEIQSKLKQAEAAIQAGQKRQAAVLLKSLLKSQPKDHNVWRLLAQIAPADHEEECLAKARQYKLAAQSQPISAEDSESALVEAVNSKPTLPKIEAIPEPEKIPTPLLADAGLDKIREKVQAKSDLIQNEDLPEAHSETGRSKRWILGVIALILLLLLGGIGWLTWSGSGTELAITQAETAEETAAIVESGPALELAESDSDNLQTVALRSSPAPESNAELSEDVEAEPTAIPTLAPTATPTVSPFLQKSITASNVEQTAWTPTPVPTNTPVPTPTLVPTAVIDNFTVVDWPAVGPNERWVDVNLTTQKLVAYEGTTPVMETAISSGLAPNFTVTGQFRIYYRLESQTMDGRRLGFDYVTPNVPHVQYFYGDFALHGAYWHSNFGSPMSHGCVNLSLPDAEWLYAWADYGTLVNVHY